MVFQKQIVFDIQCSNKLQMISTLGVERTFNDQWQGIDMNGGVVDVLAKENEEYQIRFLWKDNWETASFSTSFDANGNYLGTSGSSVSSSLMPDGRIRILIEHTFEQDVCRDLGW